MGFGSVSSLFLLLVAPGVRAAYWDYACQPPNNTYPVCSTSQSLDFRIKDLIGRLTPEEKAAQLVARYADPIERLGIPLFCFGTNVIDGVKDSCADGKCPTQFPNPEAMGATFNETAMRAMAEVYGTEARGLFNHDVSRDGWYSCPGGGLVFWGPTINIARDPRWGRNWEDPYLSSTYAYHFVRGVQEGNDPRYLKNSVTVKHWLGYSLESYEGHSRHNFDAQVDPYNLEDTYMPGFNRSINSANATGVMCSYNMLNGVPTCASPYLKSVLRDKWGFDGYVGGDTDAVTDEVSSHHYYKTDQDAVKGSLEAQCDVESSGSPKTAYASNIPTMLAAGTLEQKLVDTALYHTFSIRFRLGLFDPPASQPYASIGIDQVGTAASAALALQAATESLVLLKNDKAVLPFQASAKVLVVGPFGDTLRDALKGAGASSVEVIQVVTSTKGTVDKSQLQQALSAAKNADFLLMAVGTDTRRETFRSPTPVHHNLHSSSGSSPATVVGVTWSGGPLGMDSLKACASSILHVWQGRVPAAIGNVLQGQAPPSGKSPLTFYPAAYVNESSFLDMNVTTAPGKTYKYYMGTPLWPFGFGLSYTSFTLDFESPSTSSPTQTVHVKVANTGSTSGQETVMAFFSPLFQRGPTPVPRRQLFQFKKVELHPGQSSSVSFNVSPDQLTLVNDDGTRGNPAGKYMLTFTNGVDVSLNTTIVM
eukprot:gene3009-84_t